MKLRLEFLKDPTLHLIAGLAVVGGLVASPPWAASRGTEGPHHGRVTHQLDDCSVCRSPLRLSRPLRSALATAAPLAALQAVARPHR